MKVSICIDFLNISVVDVVAVRASVNFRKRLTTSAARRQLLLRILIYRESQTVKISLQIHGRKDLVVLATVHYTAVLGIFSLIQPITDLSIVPLDTVAALEVAHQSS